MSNLSAKILTSPSDDTDFLSALRRRVGSYEFETGAVVVQIPQVPSELLEAAVAQNRGYFAYPPASLFYLGAALDSLGVENRLLDLNYVTLDAAQKGLDPDAAWTSALDAALDEFAKPFVCVSFMFDPTWPFVQSIVQHVKARRPDCAVAVGGVAATADPQRVLEIAGADFVFLNEGERPLEAFYELVRDSEKSAPTNIAFLDDDGRYWCAPITTGGEVDMDIRPQFSKLPIESYYRIGSLNNFSRMRGVDVPFATVISRRGCRARCTFCAVRNFNGKSVRVRRAENVVDEMAHLHEAHGIRHWDWLDDDLLYDRAAALELFQLIARRLPDITWAAHNGLIAAAITPELMLAMQESGCIGFGVGLESGNAEMLRRIRKPATIETFLSFAKLSRDYPRMHYLVNFILGLPGETFSQMLDSFGLATHAALDWNNFFTFQPLKNTDAYIAYGGMDEGGVDEDVKRRGTTMNFNPVRGGNFRSIAVGDRIRTGYDIFDLDAGTVPDFEQRKEIWFTFNYIANFLRMPATATDQEQRLRNAIRWLQALGQAYEENPAINCVLYYLRWRLGADSPESIEADRERALAKFAQSEYWRHRDRQFRFSAFLDRTRPPVDERAHRWAKEPLQ